MSRRVKPTRGWYVLEDTNTFDASSGDANAWISMVGYADISSDEEISIAGDRGDFFVQRVVGCARIRYASGTASRALAGGGIRDVAVALGVSELNQDAFVLSSRIWSVGFHETCSRVLLTDMLVVGPGYSTGVRLGASSLPNSLDVETGLGGTQRPGSANQSNEAVYRFDLTTKFGFSEDESLKFFFGPFGAVGGGFGWQDGDTLDVQLGYKVLLQRRRK